MPAAHMPFIVVPRLPHGIDSGYALPSAVRLNEPLPQLRTHPPHTVTLHGGAALHASLHAQVQRRGGRASEPVNQRWQSVSAPVVSTYTTGGRQGLLLSIQGQALCHEADGHAMNV